MLKIFRVSEEERRVIWCVANQNNFLVVIQILIFMTLFGFVMYYFDKVSADVNKEEALILRASSSEYCEMFAVDKCNKIASGELLRARESVLLQAQRVRHLLRPVRGDGDGRPPRLRHLLLAQDRRHQAQQMNNNCHVFNNILTNV